MITDGLHMKHMPLISKCRLALQIAVMLLILAVISAIVLLAVREAPEPIHPELDLLHGARFVGPSVQIDTQIINEKPLFWATRTPYVEPVAVVDDEPVQDKPVENKALDDVRLIGVMGAENSSSIILKKKDENIRLSVEDEYKGWRLVEIFPEGAIFLLVESEGSDEVKTKEILMKAREPLPAVWSGQSKLILESK